MTAEDDEDHAALVPPLAELQLAFNGPHYSNQISELVKTEYDASFEQWKKLQQLQKRKVRGVILCLCLNTDIDPEE